MELSNLSLQAQCSKRNGTFGQFSKHEIINKKKIATKMFNEVT